VALDIVKTSGKRQSAQKTGRIMEMIGRPLSTKWRWQHASASQSGGARGPGQYHLSRPLDEKVSRSANHILPRIGIGDS
jgi:hypothetical protein